MKYIIIIISFLFCSSLFAQDIHFTQFYASPLNLNPALTGAFNGKYRVAMVYRDQWRGVTKSSFQTYSGAIDLRFNVNDKKVKKDVVAVGMVFNSDKANVINYNSNSILLSGAYTKCLNTENSQFLSVGLQGGIGQRNLNFDNLNFPNQFNGVDKYNLASNEVYPTNNFAFPDLSTGLNYAYNPRRNTSLFAGLSAQHLFSPNVSFFEKTNGGNKNLERKYVAHFGAQLPFGFRNSIMPRAYAAVQGNHAQLNLGTNFRLQFSDYGNTALHVGGWARTVRSSNTVGFDAAAVLIGFELNNFLMGFSYDINLKGLTSYNRNQNAFEISLGYLGEYENDAILCPKF
ncbi:MAG: PorP/SprF family type IX secretion system membrane protein [Saprospiraceae bacterium]